MIKQGDEIWELVCITSCEYNSNELEEITLGYYSTQEKANEQKDICEKQAEESNLDLEYQVEKHRIVL
jgi:hypothetical protein